MSIRDQKRRTLRPAWHMVLCVLLIGIVLYNPFAGLCHTVNHLSCEKLARNRATVGSTELQHFSPVPNPTELPDTEVDVNKAESAEAVGETDRAMIQQDVIPLRPEFFAGVWFRPPPTR